MRIVYSCIFVFLLLQGCTDDSLKPNTDTPPSKVAVIQPTGNEQYLQLNSDYIFDQEKLPTFYIDIPEENLAFLDADPAAEEYVEAMLIFEGDTISPVGIRYKGSIGGFVGCVSGSNWANPSGYKMCTKLSLKIKINWEGREEQFYGLKKIQLHAQNLDASQMRERLGYWLFRQMEVPAPRSIHARVIINGEYSGLYGLTEQIDGRFTRYHFPEGEGNLYKEIWPLKMDGNAFTEAEYLAALKTNEDENPSAEIIQDFAEALANSSPNTIQSIIESSMDLDEIIAYCMVDRMIRHDDGPFHWYCEGNDCESHNFYWYEEPISKQLHLIPWDLDNAFENIISDANPVTPIADEWGEISNGCQAFFYGSFGARQRSAACDKLTAGWVSFQAEYEAKKETFKQGPFSEIEVNQQLEKWADQIRSSIQEAKDQHSDANSVAEWESAIQQLKNQVNFARNK